MQPTETSPPFKPDCKCHDAKITESNTYDVVVLAADGALRAGRSDLPADDGDRVALETDLANDVLNVDAEASEEAGARSRVGLCSKRRQRSARLAKERVRRLTSSKLLQHWMSPVLQSPTPPASARRGRAKKVATAATRAIMANVASEDGG